MRDVDGSKKVTVEKYKKAPYQQNFSFAFSILAYSRKKLHESNKISFEHALHISRIQLRTQA